MSDLEMTCGGAGGEWWLVHDVKDELRQSREEWALDDLGAFGYGDEPGPGCENCWKEHHGRSVERAWLWAEKTAEVLTPGLAREGCAFTLLGEQRIWFRVRAAR
jgi:hypothetical protein